MKVFLSQIFVRVETFNLPKNNYQILVSKMVLFNRVLSTKIMIELAIYEIFFFVECKKILQTAKLRYLLCLQSYKNYKLLCVMLN